MRKVIAAINMSLDGFCDHTAMIADAELHNHFTALIRNGGAVIYGRVTYQLMESYWPNVVKNPTGEKDMDDFAMALENIPKIVFSRTLKSTDPIITGWKNVTLAKRSVKEEVLDLRQQAGDDIFVGSPSLIVELTKLDLIDEYWLSVHPVIVGTGLPLFKSITESSLLKLVKTETFGSGVITLYYEAIRK